MSHCQTQDLLLCNTVSVIVSKDMYECMFVVTSQSHLIHNLFIITRESNNRQIVHRLKTQTLSTTIDLETIRAYST